VIEGSEGNCKQMNIKSAKRKRIIMPTVSQVGNVSDSASFFSCSLWKAGD
jgi:hypothetical protein